MKRIGLRYWGFAVSGLMMVSLQAARAEQESPETVKAAVARIARLQAPKGSVVEVGTTAGAAAMASCGSPLAVNLEGTGSYETARVTCSAPPWKLYVPVQIGGSEQVVVATRQIRMGQRVGENDIRLVTMPANDVSGDPVQSLGQAVGKVAAAPVGPGSIVTAADLSAPVVVRYAQPVQVIVAADGVQVVVHCEAMGDGKVGEMVPVVNSISGKRFSAEIVAGEGEAPAGVPVIIAGGG